MKEILFRGKRVDNGEWVEGYYTELPCGSLGATIFSNDDELVCEDTTSYIIKVFTKQHTNYSNSNPLQVIECEKYEVIPETVGQFTGLTDRNGKKIFEGDIVKEWSSHWKTPLKTEINIYKVVCEYLGSLQLIRKTEYGENSTLLNRRSVVEVIGNIYDSPELLEELEK